MWKYLIILFSTLTFCTEAQWRGLQFERFDGRDGMTSDDIRAICQDSTGFMYFAGYQQLIRYDGHVFEDFTHDPDDSTSIGPGQINQMLPGSDGMIWLTMRRSGLNMFDPRTGTFVRFSPEVREGYISPMIEDEQGHLWLGSVEFTLLKFDPTTRKFTTYRPQSGFPDAAYDGSISGIVQDRSDPQILWLSVLGYSNPGFPSESGYNMVRFDRRDSSFQMVPCSGSICLQDESGKLWGGSWSNGIWVYDPTTQNCRNSALGNIPETELANHAITIFPHRNAFWIGSRGAVLQTDSSLHMQTVLTGTHVGNVTQFFNDRDGNTWIGSSEGLFVLHPGNQCIDYYSIRELGSDERIYPGRLAYASKENAIYLINRNEPVLYRIPLDKSTAPTAIPAADRLYGVIVDSEGNVIVASDSTLLQLDPKQKIFRPIRKGNVGTAQIDWLWVMESDGKGNIACVGPNDFYWFNERDFQIRHLHHPYEPPNSMAHTRLFLTDDGNVLLSDGASIHMVDLDSGTDRTIKSASHGHLIRDHQGSYWLGTINYIGKYALESDSLVLERYYTAKDGLVNSTATHLHVDYKGRVWIFSNNGMSVIDPVTSAVRNVGKQEGLFQNTIDPVQVINLNDGRMCTVNGNGIIVFHPDTLWNATSPTDAQVVMRDLRIVDHEPGSMHNANAISELSLRSYQNTIDIQFQGLAFPTDRYVTYSYHVTGLHNNWIHLGKNNTVTLSRLPPGSYTFRVKAGGPDSHAPVKELAFTIATPLWRQGWFVFVCLGIVLGLLFLLYQYRVQQVRRKEAEKTRMHQQIAELELHALRSQMNPHFMFNSLNSIKNYILKNESTKAAEYLSNFSHLIRMILQNSREKTVSLQDEIETLLLYIDLEKLRFRDGFEFTCQVDNRIDTHQIQIPPMIIQPYVENAIWHGLLHKESDRHLALRIFRENGSVICEVDDNGIGREKAAEIRSKSATRYKSMGMGITKDRIALMNSMNALGIHVDVRDKMNGTGTPSGTLVKIEIPDAHNSH